MDDEVKMMFHAILEEIGGVEESINKRFDTIEKHFDTIENELESLHHEVNASCKKKRIPVFLPEIPHLC